jgi:competence protein ComEC
MSWPPFVVALAFAVGIAVGDGLRVPLPLAGAIAVPLVIALIFTRRHHRMVLVLIPLTSSVLGLVAVAASRPRPPPQLFDGEPWTIEGWVASDPEHVPTGTRVPIDVSAVERGGIRRSLGLRVLINLDGRPFDPLLPGDIVRVTTRLRAPRGFVNPGSPDAAKRAAADDIAAIGSVHAVALSRMDWPPRRSLARLIAEERARMLKAVMARLDGDARGLVESLVLGDRGDVSRPLDDAFRTAGVSHVLSVSGLHLAIAAFLFYVGLRRLLVRVTRLASRHLVARVAALLALPAVVAYTMLTGAAVATVRSCIVALVWLGAVALGRRTTAMQALALAALVILCASPLELFDPSFQLSFAASAGTATLGVRWAPRGPVSGVARKLMRWVLRLCAASAAAILATAPIGAWHFAQLAPAGMISNLVVVPLAELGVVPIGLTGCLLAVAHVPGGSLLLHVAGWLAQVMALFTVGFARLVPAWRVPAPNLVEIVAWYTALVALALVGRRALRLTMLCALLLIASSLWRAIARATSTTLRATFLDVGQGDACVVELPHGHVMIVDGGGSFDPNFDPGQSVLAPFLWRRGIRRVDLIVLSHPHPDHANGLPFIVEHFPVAAVWTNGQETTQPGTVALLEAARRHGVSLESPRTLDLGGSRIRPLAPLDSDGKIATDMARSENDNSLVIDVTWRGRKLLFTGDVEAEGEAELVARGDPLAADVVKVPHHGSKTSSTAQLIAATHPSLAVISAGEHNRWHFPHAPVLARWTKAGARILRTDRDGGVTVTIDGKGRVAAFGAR